VAPQPAWIRRRRLDSEEEDAIPELVSGAAERQDRKKKRRRTLRRVAGSVSVILLSTGAAWIAAGMSFIPSPPPPPDPNASLFLVSTPITGLSLTINASRYQVVVQPAPGEQTVDIVTSNIPSAGEPPILNVDLGGEDQCWTIEHNAEHVTRWNQELKATRKQDPPLLYIGKPGEEYIDRCPANAPLTFSMGIAYTSTAFEHAYLRVPGMVVNATLPQGSTRDSPLLKGFVHTDLGLGPGFYPTNGSLADRSLRLESLQAGWLDGADCRSTSDLGEIPSSYACMSDAWWGDFSDTEAPYAEYVLPPVSADYVAPDYQELREILLLVIGGLIALAFSALFALAVPS